MCFGQAALSLAAAAGLDLRRLGRSAKLPQRKSLQLKSL
jgi:hypothetical protein